MLSESVLYQIDEARERALALPVSPIDLHTSPAHEEIALEVVPTLANLDGVQRAHAIHQIICALTSDVLDPSLFAMRVQGVVPNHRWCPHDSH